MRYLVFSDLHGSASGIKALIEAYHMHQPDALLCLGDVLYFGPRNGIFEGYDVQAVIDGLTPLKEKILAVRGNCDSEVDEMVLGFPLLETYHRFLLGPTTILMSHGHIYNENHLPPLPKGSLFLYGHTHVYRFEEKDGIYLCNPGSIALAKNGNPNTYALLEDNCFTLYDTQHKRLQSHLF